MLPKNVITIVQAGGTVKGLRPSNLGEARFDDDWYHETPFWRPFPYPFICPECQQDFQFNAEALGEHLTIVHYPRIPKHRLARPHKCKAGCGRYLEWNTRYDRSEGRAHEKICNKFRS